VASSRTLLSDHVYRTVWRNCFGRFYGPVVRADCWMNMKTVVMDRISCCSASLVTNFCNWRTVWALCGFTATSLSYNKYRSPTNDMERTRFRHVLTSSVYVIFRFVMSAFGSSWNPDGPHTVPSAGRHWYVSIYQWINDWLCFHKTWVIIWWLCSYRID
jgi:hypothetical protein